MGGGFSGVELIAEMNDFMRRAEYPNIDPRNIQMILLHSGERILEKKMSVSLSLYVSAS